MNNNKVRIVLLILGGIFFVICFVLIMLNILKPNDSIQDVNKFIFETKTVSINNKNISFVHYYYSNDFYHTYLDLIVDEKKVDTYVLYDDSIPFNYCYNCPGETEEITDKYLKERFSYLYDNNYRLEQIDDVNYVFSYNSFGSEFDMGLDMIILNSKFEEIDKINLDFTSGYEFEDSYLNAKLFDVNKKYFIESGYLYFYDYPCNTMNEDGKLPLYKLTIEGNLVKKEIINYYSGKMVGEKC